MVRRSRTSRGRGKKGVVSVDLSDVQTFVAFPEMDRVHLRVKEIEEGEGDAGDYWKWTFEDASKKPVDGTVTHITSFAKQALFNLKSLLESLEVEIPESEFDLAIDDMIGLEMMAQTAQEDVETDNGRRTYTRIVDHWPVSEDSDKPGKRSAKDDDAEEEVEETARRGSKRSRKAKEVTEEDVGDMSQDELEAVIEEHGLDIDLGDFRTVSKMRAGVIDALKEAGVIEGEDSGEEEEEEKPARSSRSSRRSAKKDEEEEEDDRPTKTSSRGRRAKDEEDEEEERPARRRRR